MLDELRKEQPLDAIALAVPGPFDRRTGELIILPGMPQAWHGPWRGLKLVEELGNRYHCPVYIENDANCAALAEAHLGAGRYFSNVVYYSISTGVGGGIVHDGMLYSGRHDTDLAIKSYGPNT